MTPWILHVDLDQFLAAVEVLRRPELAGRPVIVGGDGDPTRPRQVVATASYEARAFGVRSGMPLGQALRRCPDGVFLPSDHPAYDAASADVMATLRSFGWPVEVWGWDEAFVGITADDPERIAHDIKRRVLERTRLSCAVGIGRDEAAGEDGDRVRQARRGRPADTARLDRHDGCPAGHRDLGHRWPDGATARRARHPLRRGPRAGRPPRPGRALRTERSARTCVCSDSVATTRPSWTSRGWRSRGARRRRSPATSWAPTPSPRTSSVSPRPSPAEVVTAGRRITHVAVKVRTASFWTRTKIAKLPDGPTTDPDIVAAAAAVVLARFELRGPVRLLGVRVMLEPTVTMYVRRHRWRFPTPAATRRRPSRSTRGRGG